MKNLFLAFCISVFTLPVLAQSYEGKGDMKFDVGYDLYGYGTGIKTNFDYGSGKLFSIGAGASFYLSNDENDYFIYARTSFHLGELLDLPCRLDIYPGIELGYLSRSDVGITGYLGMRYFFSERIGLFAEIGNNGAIGLSINI